MPSGDGLVGLGGAGRAGPGGGASLGGLAGPAGPGRWAWLRSQGLGLVCGFGTALLLAVGSVVLVVTRDGASAGVGVDDLSAFFTRPSPAHLWLYLLIPLAGLYALNATLATWDNVLRRWRSGQRAPTAYAAAVLHVAFLVALLAHAVGGFGSAEEGAVVVASGWQPLPGFGEVRLRSLVIDPLPNGAPRQVRAGLEVRDPGGAVAAAEVGYNRPLASGLGARLALLQDQGRTQVARLASGTSRCALTQGQGCQVAGEPVELVAFGQAPGTGAAAALVRAGNPSGEVVERWVVAGDLLAMRHGRPLELEAVEVEPAVLLRVRRTPGNPLALLAAAILAIGAGLLWRRLGPRGAA